MREVLTPVPESAGNNLTRGARNEFKRQAFTCLSWSSAIAGTAAVVLWCVRSAVFSHTHHRVDQVQQILKQGNHPVETPPYVPAGVNLGGWLCLEDWFFSGTLGEAVSTGHTTPQGQGACLPPHISQLSEPWPSEGNLTKRLNDSKGPAFTAEAFMAHRRSYIGNADVKAMQELGIKFVRIPITWAAFADALKPINEKVYGSHDPEHDAAVVPDPFYDSAMVTVPRAWLKSFIQKLAKHDIKALLDLHAMPGGSSEGTYNGVWPSLPMFWMFNDTIGNGQTTLRHAGQLVSQALIDWVDTFNSVDMKGIVGLTLMNEPAHQLASASPPWASQLDVLAWLEESSGRFRHSRLPSRGVKLYVNVIETAFHNFDATVGKWWNSKFSSEERNTWAVIDRHHYNAWGGSTCSGRTVSGGAYYCDQPLEEINKTIHSCTESFAASFSNVFTGLKAASEWSLGTFDQARFACTDQATNHVLLQEQLRSLTAHGIESFFWTWRMPYGPTFEPGWSLKSILGKETPSNLPCMAPKISIFI